MKLIPFVFTLNILFAFAANANNCIAHPPEASVLSEKVSAYQKFEDPENQIVTERFKTEALGDVIIRFEACNHMIWTVIFLSSDPFNSTISQNERFKKLLNKLSAIPFSSHSRFNDFLSSIKEWQTFSQNEELIKPDSYFLWRRKDDMFTDIILKSAGQGNRSRTEITLNFSL